MRKFYESYYIIQALRIVKFFHDIGKFEDAMKHYTWIESDDLPELFMNGMQYLAPFHESKDLGEDVCCGGHYQYRFSDPALIEYFRLCRLYELRHSITPKDNPYVKKADDDFVECCKNVGGDFGAYYDNDDHPREVQFETCPERPVDEFEFMVCIHNVLEFYRKEVKTLQKEMMRGPMVFLPALPAPKGDSAREKAA